MKKWFLCLTVTLLAACAQSSGSGGGGVQVGASCSAKPVHLAALGAVEADPLDPFSTTKLALDHSYSDLTASGIVETESSENFAAGTEFTVSLHVSCPNPGAISSQIFSANPDESDASPRSGIRAYRWSLPSAMSGGDLEHLIESDACVHGVSESSTASVGAFATDPMASKQDHLRMLGIDQIPAALSAAAPVVVAVIDSGIDMNHEDLKHVLWRNTKEIPGNGIDDDHNGYVDDVNGYNFATNIPSPQHQGSWSGIEHGSHVAGLIAAERGNGVGVSGSTGANTKLMALNVFGPTPGAYTANIANAIRYAADNGADVINLSLGGSGKNAAYQSALAYAVSKGVVVLAAAGNDASAFGSSYFMSPAGYGKMFAGVISVGSVDSTNSAFSTFSNYGPAYVEIGAPGSENSKTRYGLLSTLPGNRYGRMEGTSMATPVAAGSAALAIGLFRAKGYQPSAATVEAVLEVSSKRLSALQKKIRDGRVLNLKLLTDYIQNAYPSRGSGQDPGVPGYDACAVGGS